MQHVPNTGRQVDLLEEGELRDEVGSLHVSLFPSQGVWVHPRRRVARRRVGQVIAFFSLRIRGQWDYSGADWREQVGGCRGWDPGSYEGRYWGEDMGDERKRKKKKAT
jgi:hypothetical protein